MNMSFVTIFESGSVEVVTKDVDFKSPGKLAFTADQTGVVNLIMWDDSTALLAVEVIQVLNPRVKQVVSTNTTVVGDIFVGFQ